MAVNAKDILAIIPARGGSKGIPGKNIRPLGGKPLINYTIEVALEAESITRVIVSTDADEISEVASLAGAEIVRRPDEISGDSASSETALLHTLEVLRDKEQYIPDVVVFLQCTSPLTAPADIDGTVAALFNENADSALAVTPFHYYLWATDENNSAVGINHDKVARPLRQERENQYLETGAVYVMRTAGFLEAKHRFFGKTVVHETPEERCFEIDEPIDLVIVEAMLAAQKSN